MKKSKKKFVKKILFLILSLSVWFIVLDFSRFFKPDYSYDIFPSAVLKRICVVLAALIAWSVGRDGLNATDSRKIKAAFLFACLGETAFAISERIPGVIMFGFCQTLLIMRHGEGLIPGLRRSVKRQRSILYIISAVSAVALAVFAILFGTLITSSSTFILVFLYAVVLNASLLTALANNLLHLYPPVNSRMAAVGMACFFCCDVLVGLDAVLAVGLPWLLANSFIWGFYIPALVLLALSSYRYGADT